MKIDLIEQNIKNNIKTQEEMNTLRTNIMFYGKSIKVICLTSINENEGKSTISLELAYSFSNLGKKTVLLSADTRKLTSYFITNTKLVGLTEYLSDNSTMEDIVLNTSNENLDLITQGAIPPNPTILLENEKFSKLISELKEEYDYVIIDTPPIGIVVDAAIIAKKSDATILVVESNRISKKRVNKIVSKLKSINDKFLGVILNKFVTKDHFYGSYGYYSNKK